MNREERIGNARLLLGDARELLPTLGQFNAVVTSPPYDNVREYGGHAPVDCLAVISAIAKQLAPGGVCVWNVADQTVNGSETGTSFRQALHAMDQGLRLHDTMIYCKEAVTSPNTNRYHPAFEYVFVFSNGAPTHFNGIKDWPNKTFGRFVDVGLQRKADGSTKPRPQSDKTTPTHSLRRNWWVLANAYTGDTAGHPAPMPYSLAADHITTWTAPGETVCDPFLGSGTSGAAAVRLGREFVGIEIEPSYFDIACRRIEAAQRQADLFVRPAPGTSVAPAPHADLFTPALAGE